MTIRPLRDRRYVVETDGGTYVVALDAGTCTCPDHAIAARAASTSAALRWR